MTGGRDYKHAHKVFEALGEYLEDECSGLLGELCVIQGGSTGADAWARRWAEESGVCSATFHANWTKLGDIAGPMRNRQMFKFLDISAVLAFPGGAGTKGCIREAKRSGVEVRLID